MKRVWKVLAVSIVAVLLMGLVACGKFTCAACGEKKSGKKHNVFGEDVCSSCYSLVEAYLSSDYDF